VRDIDFEVNYAAENSNNFQKNQVLEGKISWGCGNTWANCTGHTSVYYAEEELGLITPTPPPPPPQIGKNIIQPPFLSIFVLPYGLLGIIFIVYSLYLWCFPWLGFCFVILYHIYIYFDVLAFASYA
jgi:hypothetical protein